MLMMVKQMYDYQELIKGLLVKHMYKITKNEIKYFNEIDRFIEITSRHCLIQ